MPVKASIITYQDALDELACIPKKELRVTERFMNGDHWQGGDGWTGWKPLTVSQEAQRQFLMVERLFNSKNVISGMVKRIRGAILGKEPDWEVVSKDKEQEADLPDPMPTVPGEKPKPKQKSANEKFFEDIDRQMTDWYTKKKIHQKLKDFVTNKAAYGKAAIRIYIPPGYVTSDSNGTGVQAKDFADALDKIYVDVPHYSAVIDPKDPEYGERYVVTELAKMRSDDPTTLEITYLDENRQTVIRQITDNPQVAAEKQTTLDLGGNLLTYVHGEFKDAIISETVKRQQMAVNHAKTGENFALENINFPETTFINASIPTEKVKGENGKMVETPKAMHQGPGIWRSIIGLITLKGDGGEVITTPQVITREMADPDRFAKVADNNTRDMHQEAGMLYIYLADSEYASGKSRVEAMTDYLILLVDSKTIQDTAGEWLIDSVVKLAFFLTNQMDRMDQYQVIFSSKITIGRVSVEDKTIMIEEVANGLRSKRNYMITAEVTDDPVSELKVIATDGPLKNAPPPPMPGVLGTGVPGNGQPGVVPKVVPKPGPKQLTQ
jgi:hypothetical protein